MNRLISRTFLLALFVTGFVLFVLGVLYLITPVEALPSFLGGVHREGLRTGAFRTKRADVALILGTLFLIASWWLYARSTPRLDLPHDVTEASWEGESTGSSEPTR
jgi:hypothetical protein